MRRLMFFISTKGKSSKQVGEEGWAAYQKYRQTEETVLRELEAKKQQLEGAPPVEQPKA